MADKYKKKKVPQTKVSTKKAWRKMIFDHQLTIMKRVRKNRREMKEGIIREVEKEIGDKIDMIEAIYKRTIIIQNIWFDKGLITRKEISEKYEELKKKRKEG